MNETILEDETDKKKSKNFEKIVRTRRQKEKESGSKILQNSVCFKKDEYESNLAKIMEDQQIQSDIKEWDILRYQANLGKKRRKHSWSPNPDYNKEHQKFRRNCVKRFDPPS